MKFVYLGLLIVGYAAIQCMAGGTRLVLCLPCYIILALAAILTVASLRRTKVAPSLSCLITTTVMAGYVIWRSIHSPIHYLARMDYFMMLACLVVYLLTCFFLHQKNDRLTFVILLLAIAIVEIIFGSIQFTQSNGYMPFGFLRGDNTQRASGMFVSPNHYAGYLEAVGIIALSLMLWSRWPLWAKIAVGYLAGFCWFGIAISGSRGGYFSTLTSLVAFGIATVYAIKVLDPSKLARVWVVLAIGLAGVLCCATFLMFNSEYLTRRIHMMTASDVRIYNWMAALDQFRLEPLLGTGSGTHLIYGRAFRRPPIQADPIHAHCDYLELLAEYGVAGVCLTAAFVAAHVRSGFRAYSSLLRQQMLASYDQRSDSFALNVGALCALAALGVHSVVDFNMHAPGDALLFAFLFGTLASPGVENATPLSAKLSPIFRFALPALGLWLAIAAIPKLPAEYCSEISRVALRNGEFNRSIEYAKKALGETPPEAQTLDRLISHFGGDAQNFFLWFYIGESTRIRALGIPGRLLRASYMRTAVEAYRRGLEIFPQHESMLIRMGQSLDALGLYDEAEDAFQKALKADPNLGVTYGYYGTHLNAMGRKEEAAEAYKTGRHLSNDAIDQLGRKELGL